MISYEKELINSSFYILNSLLFKLTFLAALILFHYFFFEIWLDFKHWIGFQAVLMDDFI